jgi:hypothetical protein
VDKQQCTTTTTVDPGYDACQEKKQMVEEAALLACEAAVDTDWIPFVGEAAATACAALVGTALLYACPDLDSSITTTRKCVTVHADPDQPANSNVKESSDPCPGAPIMDAVPSSREASVGDAQENTDPGYRPHPCE